MWVNRIFFLWKKTHFLFRIKIRNNFSSFSFDFSGIFHAKIFQKWLWFFWENRFFWLSACMWNLIFANFHISWNVENSALFRKNFIDFLSNFLQRDIWKMISNFWEFWFFWFFGAHAKPTSDFPFAISFLKWKILSPN